MAAATSALTVRERMMTIPASGVTWTLLGRTTSIPHARNGRDAGAAVPHHAGDPAAYTMTREQILAHVDPEICEIHIVGGLHNKWRFDDYLEVIRLVKSARPDLSVKAYTAVEIDFFCRLTKQPAEWVLGELRA